MNKEIHNGYCVTGNHKALIGGREYHVEDSTGKLLKVEDCKGLAVAHANLLPEGDAKEEKPKAAEKVDQPELKREEPKKKVVGKAAD